MKKGIKFFTKEKENNMVKTLSYISNLNKSKIQMEKLFQEPMENLKISFIKEENKLKFEKYYFNKIPEEKNQLDEEGNQDVEALFLIEDGRVIFRNGLLRGIIHKYNEIEEVVSKIQNILYKGAKFNLEYKAFDSGDKAKNFP